MKGIKRVGILSAIFSFLLLAGASRATDYFNIPPLPAPEQYGNILINRMSEQKGVRPVAFSHWSHRMKYTCRVCHSELEFSFQVGTTEITEKENTEGRFCGACHNGKEAFGHTKENCDKCHNGNIEYGVDKFNEIKKQFPTAPFGNGINWVKALNKGLIKPKDTILGSYQPMSFDKKLVMDCGGIPPAVFPHKAHTQWLDCSNCHPDIFNIKKKTTKHFSMERILNSEFCGVCHLRTAFPLNDCKRCHPM